MKQFMHCGSGFPAAIRFNTGSAVRGWETAPTFKSILWIFKLMHVRLRGRDTGFVGYQDKVKVP
jgi:hypothetical protein